MKVARTVLRGGSSSNTASLPDHITGKGNANKQQVINAVKQLGHQPQDDNEADAIAIAYWAIKNRLGGNNEYLDSRTSGTAV